MFLLDTDHIGIIQWKSQPEYGRISQRMVSHPRSAFWLSVVSFQEQVLGANLYISRAKTNAGILQGYKLLGWVLNTYSQGQVLSFDQAEITMYDSLVSQKIRVGTMDLRIAATALVHNLTVLTRNLRDFSKIPGLLAEDWTA